MRNLKLGRVVKVVAVAGVVLAGITPVHAQFASPTGDRGPMNTTFGGNYKDPQQRAADNLAKGLRFKAKADEEPDARKKTKLLDKAKKEFQSSIALHPNHDAYLALGLVQMQLGNAQASVEACMQAAVLKPGSEAAEDCALSAQRKLHDEGQGGGGGGER